MTKNSLSVQLLLTLLVGCGHPKETETPVTPANMDTTETQVETTETTSEVNTSGSIDERVSKAVALLTSSDSSSINEAIRQLKLISEEVNDRADVLYNIGVGYVELGKTDEARKYFLKTTDMDKTFSQAWYNLAILSEREEGLDSALSTFKEGLKFSEASSKLQAGVVDILRRQKKYDLAIDTGKNYLEENANNLDIYNTLGLIYIEQEELDMAKFIFRLAEQKNGGSENAKLLSSYGYLLYLLDDFTAKDKLLSALEYDPSLIQARVYLSNIHLDNRAFKLAIEQLEASLEYDPNNPTLHMNLGVAYRGNNEADKAEKEFQKALELQPENVDPILNLAILQSDNRNDYEGALTYVDEYIEKGGTETEQAEEWRVSIAQSKDDFEIQEKRNRRAAERRKRSEERQKRLEEERKLEEDEEKKREEDEERERLKELEEAERSDAPPTPSEEAVSPQETDLGSDSEETSSEPNTDDSTESEASTETEGSALPSIESDAGEGDEETPVAPLSEQDEVSEPSVDQEADGDQVEEEIPERDSEEPPEEEVVPTETETDDETSTEDVWGGN